MRLRDLSYISPRHDYCGVFGPPKALQRSVRAAAVTPFNRNCSDNLIFVLLASPD